MEKRMSAWETRRQFGQVLKDVSRDRTKVVIESHGEAVAVVIPISIYQDIKRQQQRMLDQLRRYGDISALSEEEAMAESLRLVNEVRTEMDETGN